MGTPTLEDLSDEGKKIFWKGMKTFASLDNVFIKISMLCYIDPNWDENELVIQQCTRLLNYLDVNAAHWHQIICR